MSHDHITVLYIFAKMYSCTCSHVFVLWYVANLFQKEFGIIKQLLPLSEGDMTIFSPSTCNIALGLCPRAISPASGEQIVMSPSLKGNNCIMAYSLFLVDRKVFTHSFASDIETCILSLGKGGKNRRRGKNENEKEKRELVFKEDGQGK